MKTSTAFTVVSIPFFAVALLIAVYALASGEIGEGWGPVFIQALGTGLLFIWGRYLYRKIGE